MALSVTATFADAMTPQGLKDIWSNGFGILKPFPDTAAMILGPQSLITGPVLSSFLLSDLTLDPATVKSVKGAFTVEIAANTGLVVASATISLSVSLNSLPVGMALYSASGGDLFYISAFSSWPNPIPSPFTWNVKIALGSCLT